MQTRFETGTAFLWDNDSVDPAYGVVLDNNNGIVTAAFVLIAEDDTKCYNEGGAIREHDEHNVRLDCCPPPFRFLCAFNENGCYAYGDPNTFMSFDTDQAEELGISIIDEGELVSGSKVDEIKDHPWRDEKEAGIDNDGGDKEAEHPDTQPVPLFAALMAQNAATDAAWAERDPDGPEYG